MLVETGYAGVDGGRLYYETSGKGPALVLIHAGFLDSRMWDTQFQLFSENYRVIRYDVRGFGNSDVARTKFSDYKDLRGILDHLGAKTASLVGVSNGGEMDVNAWAPAQTLANRERITQIAMDNFHVHVENPWKLQVPPEPRTWERLSNIRVPTLLIIGDRDVPEQILMVHNIHTHIPGSKKVLIQGGDHIVNMSKPDEFNRTVLEFLRTQTQEIQA